MRDLGNGLCGVRPQCDSWRGFLRLMVKGTVRGRLVSPAARSRPLPFFLARPHLALGAVLGGGKSAGHDPTEPRRREFIEEEREGKGTTVVCAQELERKDFPVPGRIKRPSTRKPSGRQMTTLTEASGPISWPRGLVAALSASWPAQTRLAPAVTWDWLRWSRWETFPRPPALPTPSLFG